MQPEVVQQLKVAKLHFYLMVSQAKVSNNRNREHEYENNGTTITEVILMGFRSSKEVNIFLFALILVVYIFTIYANLLIITLVFYSKTLHTPMYFLLIQLSLSDLILSTDIAPNLLYIIVREDRRISFTKCVVQQYVFAVAECTECLIVTVMSYDRYLAICSPLHYTSIMNNFFCAKLVLACWLLSFLVVMVDAIAIASLKFCGPNIIDHFFCDVLPLLKLSCSDPLAVQLIMFLTSVVVVFLPFVVIVISYSCVIVTILRIQSTTGKQKAFSTCSSHLTVVSIFYVSIIFTYGIPNGGQLLNLDKLLALFYTVGTPLINPGIYSLRNKEIKTSFVTLVRQMKKQK
ncbi:olfactory receptor 6B1-like [Hyperolius riggenbachi]|uniref:olfactory receptor 6B1-like n=1 Tax=Hyperolius riggenbachi TaxID=752182 RepID=UPI0035A2CF3B